MNTKISVRAAACCAFVAAMLVVVPAMADEKKLGWSDVAEFSSVFTDGNSESATFGLKNLLAYDWEEARFIFRAGGIRVESETSGRSASCPAGDGNADGICDGPVNFQDPETDTTAENYFVNLRYSRDVTPKFFWYTGANWDRNEFAGIKNRYIGEAGVGNTWIDTDDVSFKTSYGLTFTDQEDVVEIEGIDDTYAGYRFTWGYSNKLTGNTTYTNVLIADGNADEGSDWRADMDNGLAVAMNDKVALKLGLRLLYDNEPSFDTLVPANLGVGGALDPVVNQLDELDTIFTASLVVNFM